MNPIYVNPMNWQNIYIYIYIYWKNRSPRICQWIAHGSISWWFVYIWLYPGICNGVPFPSWIEDGKGSIHHNTPLIISEIDFSRYFLNRSKKLERDPLLILIQTILDGVYHQYLFGGCRKIFSWRSHGTRQAWLRTSDLDDRDFIGNHHSLVGRSSN